MSEQASSSIPPFFNKLMRALLRSPLHRIASRSVMLISFTGRKSGKTYTTPISYKLEGDQVTAFTHAKWSRNLADGAPVLLNIKRKVSQGWADVVFEDKDLIAENLWNFLRTVRSDARFYDVSFDDDGEPNWEDVKRAAQSSYMLQVQLNGGLQSS